jgi:RNA polymerase sigma factor (sigma-70 family)
MQHLTGFERLLRDRKSVHDRLTSAARFEYMPEPHQFRTTRWTQVIAARGASPEGRQALRDLCETYYEPVALFIQRSRPAGLDEARDLTHEFFTLLLEGQRLDQADQSRGRFRSYLLGAVKHFLADRRDREQAQKRGGDRVIQSLSEDPGAIAAHTASLPPDAYFDRQWGLTVVQQAITVLKQEAEAAGELSRFAALQPWLVTPSGHDTALATAQSLGLSEGAFKVVIHRLRKRFRQVVLERVSATVDDPSEVQLELNYLIEVLGERSSATPPDP